MNKTIIHLIVPAIGEEYDVCIQPSLLVGELTKLLIKALVEITDKLYMPSGNEILCLKEKNIVLHQDVIVQSYGIRNGDHIVLI